MVGVFLLFSHVKNAQYTDSYMKKGGQIKMSKLTFFPPHPLQGLFHSSHGSQFSRNAKSETHSLFPFSFSRGQPTIPPYMIAMFVLQDKENFRSLFCVPKTKQEVGERG